MFWSTFLDLQHPFNFKYQVDKAKYVKFLIPIHQTNLFNIGLPVKGQFKFQDKVKLLYSPQWGGEAEKKTPCNIDLKLPQGFHSSLLKVIQIPDCPRRLWHTNSNQTRQNSCQAWQTTLPTTMVHNKIKWFFFVHGTSKFIKKLDIALNW